MSQSEDEREPNQGNKKETWAENLLKRHGLRDCEVKLVVHQGGVVGVTVTTSVMWEQLKEDFNEIVAEARMEYGGVDIYMKEGQVTRVDVRTIVLPSDPNKETQEYGGTLLANLLFSEDFMNVSLAVET